MLFGDVNKSDSGVFHILNHIEHSYTILPDVAQGWRWGNAVTSLLVPQRGFLLGIPLAVIVFTQWWQRDARTQRSGAKREGAKREPKEAPHSKPPRHQMQNSLPFALCSFPHPPHARRRLRRRLAAVVHAHSFIAAMGVGGVLALINIKTWREWFGFFVVASRHRGTAVALVDAWLGGQHARFYRLGIWLGSRHRKRVCFWLKNTGVFIPLLVAALLWKTDHIWFHVSCCCSICLSRSASSFRT